MVSNQWKDTGAIIMILTALILLAAGWPASARGADLLEEMRAFKQLTGIIAGTLNRPVAAPQRQAASRRAEHWPTIVQAGRRHGLDPRLIHAVIRHESGYDSRAVSPKGAQGLMQLMPQTARELGVTNPFDPAQNISGGTRYLRAMVDRFGDLRKALMAYNAGPGRVESGRIPGESLRYARQVIDTYRRTLADSNS